MTAEELAALDGYWAGKMRVRQIASLMGYSPWTIAAVTKRFRERYPRRKYHRAPEERAHWAGLVISGELGVVEAALRAGVTEVTIRNWVRHERGSK